MLKEGTLDQSGGGEAGFSRRRLLIGGGALAAAAALESRFGPLGTWALGSETPAPTEPLPIPANNSEQLSEAEVYIKALHRGATLSLRYNPGFSVTISDGTPQLDRPNLNDSVGLATTARVGYYSLLTTAHDFKNDKHDAPYAHTFDGLASGFLKDGPYAVYNGDSLDTVQRVGHMDAIAISGKNQADIALTRVHDPSKLDKAQIPRLEVANTRLTPGERVSICGFPAGTYNKDHYWMTYIAPITLDELYGHETGLPFREFYVSVLNPASFKDAEVKEFGTGGMSGSNVVGQDGKVYGLISTGVKPIEHGDDEHPFIKLLASKSNVRLARLAQSDYNIQLVEVINHDKLQTFINVIGRLTT